MNMLRNTQTVLQSLFFPETTTAFEMHYFICDNIAKMVSWKKKRFHEL